MVGSSRLRIENAAAATRQILLSLSEFLVARIANGARLCIALSGGRDSVVLLHALDWLRSEGADVRLSAVHVHHGLNDHADTWKRFCSDFCRDLGIPLDVVHVDVPRDGGEGLEAAARRQRYGVLAACRADGVMLAHHRDDQAETVLFRLLRGSGVNGAAAMRMERSQAGGPPLFRPLLDVPGRIIAAYAAEQSLSWVEDESNMNGQYRRNFLRRDVLPRIEVAFPGAAQALARAAGHFADAALLLAEVAQADREKVVGVGGRIDVARFNTLPVARARNLLRYELLSADWRAPDARWINEVLRQLTTVEESSVVCITTPDGDLRVYRGQLYVLHRSPVVPPTEVLWQGEARLPWGNGWVSFAPCAGGGIHRRLLAGTRLCLRRRRGGERLQIDARRPRRELTKLWQEVGVPPWERCRVPFLWSDDRLVWVSGIGFDAAFACPVGEHDGLQLTYDRYGDASPDKPLGDAG